MDLFANSHILISVFESFPKDKTALLGTVEIPLFDRFIRPKNSILSFKEVFPIIYSNSKLLTPGGDIPEMEIHVSLSRSILSESEKLGSLISFTVQDVYPVPEEWSLKEGNEKDLSSSKYRNFSHV